MLAFCSILLNVNTVSLFMDGFPDNKDMIKISDWSWCEQIRDFSNRLSRKKYIKQSFQANDLDYSSDPQGQHMPKVHCISNNCTFVLLFCVCNIKKKTGHYN